MVHRIDQDIGYGNNMTHVMLRDVDSNAGQAWRGESCEKRLLELV